MDPGNKFWAEDQKTVLPQEATANGFYKDCKITRWGIGDKQDYVSAADHLTQKTIQAAVVPQWGHVHRGPLCCKRLGTAILRWDGHTYNETRPQLRHPRTLPDSCARG